jgi:hypothetical protein
MKARTHNEMEEDRLMEIEVDNYVKQCNAQKKREQLIMDNKTKILTERTKWDEFRVRRSTVIKEYLRIKKRMARAR